MNQKDNFVMHPNQILNFLFGPLLSLPCFVNMEIIYRFMKILRRASYPGKVASLSLLLLATSSNAYAAKYKGVGGQIEAYGTVVLAYLHPQQLILECADRYPGLKANAEAANKFFLARNKPIYDQVTAKMKILAYKNGGDVELKRLSKEITDSLPRMVQVLRPKTKEMTETENYCRAIFTLVFDGYMDVNVRNKDWIDKILSDEKN